MTVGIGMPLTLHTNVTVVPSRATKASVEALFRIFEGTVEVFMHWLKCLQSQHQNFQIMGMILMNVVVALCIDLETVVKWEIF